jgi:acyl-coenzyme A thioesterase PaaI-like protein
MSRVSSYTSDDNHLCSWLLSLPLMTNNTDAVIPALTRPVPGQLMAAGHAAGDFLGAPSWRIVERRPGLLTVDVHLPDSLKNPQGQLFGGFTPTYVDMVSLFTARTDGDDDPDAPQNWLTTINMRCDYFEPIVEDRFTITGEIINRRGLTCLVSTKFFQGKAMAAHAVTTVREVPGATL